jgi:hypothetical protein
VPCLQPHFVPLSLRRGKQAHLAMSRARFVDFLHLRFGQAAHLVQSHGGNEGAAPPRHSRRVPAPVSICDDLSPKQRTNLFIRGGDGTAIADRRRGAPGVGQSTRCGTRRRDPSGRAIVAARSRAISTAPK